MTLGIGTRGGISPPCAMGVIPNAVRTADTTARIGPTRGYGCGVTAVIGALSLSTALWKCTEGATDSSRVRAASGRNVGPEASSVGKGRVKDRSTPPVLSLSAGGLKRLT